MFRSMKPETIERRRIERAAKQAASTALRIERLKAKAAEAGPDSIWAEMLKEQRQ